MKKIALTILSMCFVSLIFAQDWAGFYTLNIDEDGYKGTVQAQIYQMNGEYWGQLRGSGNAAFGEKWQIEFWTILNDGSLDCYYDQGNDVKFPVNNALIFALVGNKAKFTTTFGDDLFKAVSHLEGHRGFYLDNSEGEIQEFTSVQTPAVGKASKPTTATKIEAETPITPKPAVTLTPPKLSKTDLLIGRWTGEEASDLTKFFDYDFNIDGSGRRGMLDFYWAYKTEGGKDYLDVQYFKPITRKIYQDYLVQVDKIETRDDLTIFKTSDGKTHQIKIGGDDYSELESSERYLITILEDNKLELSFTYNGKIVKTLHYK
jgi:hypothetical protein